MDSDSFENWQLCWEVNTLFHRGTYDSDWFKCLWCKRVAKVEVPTSTWSQFALAAASCSAAHIPNYSSAEGIQNGVCPECEVDLVEKITKRRQICWEDGCKRYMLVKSSVIQNAFEATLTIKK
jgi:hypothetical protein